MSEESENENPTSDAPAPWAAPPEELVFAVTFGDGGIFGVAPRPTDSLRLVGKGELRIGPGGIAVLGRTRDFFISKQARHEFEGADVSNVQVGGRSVRFRIPPADGLVRHVLLQAEDEDSAERIARLLPAARSKQFADELATLTEFHERLDSVSSPPLVTPALVAANVLYFVIMAFNGAGVMEPDGEVAVRWGSNFTPLTAAGEWWRLLSSTFIHFGLIHLALNMFALYQTGHTTERLFGRGRFLALYLFAGLTGSLASLVWHPVVNSAGASGAIFGVFGGLLAFVLNPRNRVPGIVMTEHRNSTLLFAGYSLFFGAVHPGIDNAAHVGGLVGGFVMGLLLARPVEASARARAGVGRLALGAAAGVAVIALMLVPVLRPGQGVQDARAYQMFLRTFQQREEAAIALMDEAVRKYEGEGGPEAYVRLMGESEQLWTAMHQELQGFTLPPDSAEATQLQGLTNYVDARARWTRAVPLTIRGDAAAIAAAEQADKDAAAALEQLK